ncbi:Protein dopey [Candida viswanathii]|uniref:Protein dopey n=1 Tax=Candida viswanathii TaxID=5486 RepID=A0A367YGS2_9ASCO|nr:Protein dopey [Candida viswanathii]
MKNPRSSHPPLSLQDKKYIQLVEKALASFEALEEWADYIAFLSRLQKSLQLRQDSPSSSLYFVPHASQVSNKLSLCLSPTLPNGVHQKVLSVYEYILDKLPAQDLNRTINVWLPGLLPLFSYSSILVKPMQIKIFHDQILAKLTPATLHSIAKPFILCLLAGLDDENSEVFGDVLDLVDFYKLKLADDSHFWQSMFLCIIKNPERRLGALHWCSRRLPLFINSKDSDGNAMLSEEAQLCLKPEPGLLVRALAISIGDPKSFDIVVVRGFFDLLVSHVPLDSDVVTNRITPKDREVLVMSCSKITLRKDMSLNRRLWTYFLGPEMEGDHKKTLSRSEYFKQFAEPTLTAGLLKMVHSDRLEVKTEAFKILLPLVMDKWEISTVLTPKLFSPFLKVVFQHREKQELMHSAQALFDEVESIYIWSDILDLVLNNENDNSDDYNLDVLEFVLKDFNVNEEEMVTVHVPFTVLCLLANSRINTSRLKALQLLIGLVPGRLFESLESVEESTSADIISKIQSWYASKLQDEDATIPFTKEQTAYLIIHLLQEVYLENVTETRYCIQIATLLSQIRNYSPRLETQLPQDVKLVDKILELPRTTSTTDETGLLIAFGLSKFINLLSPTLDYDTNEKVFKVLLANLWTAIHSSDPANYQVEAVRAIFELEVCYPIDKIEAGLLELFLELPQYRRVIALETLWIHSTSINESDKILERPLQILLDGFSDSSSQTKLSIDDFLKKIIKSGASNRLLKLITNPILNFGCIYANRTTFVVEDDLGQLSYYLHLIVKVVSSDVKLLRECFNNELAVMDNKKKIDLVHENNWDISTYKSLLLSVIEKFFELSLVQEVLDDKIQLQNYYSCMDNCLGILELLVTGNENNFGDLLMSLIHVSAKILKSDINSQVIEAVQSKFLHCIFYYLKVATDLRLNLNLLHVEEQNKNPMLINFIILGVSKAESPILLEKWISLLVRSLYLFGESVFSVLLVLNDTLVKKVEDLFNRFSSWHHFKDTEDFESSIDILFNGLEDLLSISHSYLLTANFKQQVEKQSTPGAENGFLNSVILGVFQIESPAIRSSEQNKLYSILLAIHDVVRASYKIWYWSDARPVVPETVDFYSDKSLTYISHKLKFRARKLLESLVDLERQEVTETLIILKGTVNARLKLLNILDGGRPQMTLPSLFTSILSKCNAQLLPELPKTTIDAEVQVKELSSFLVAFFEFMDTDSVTDVWNMTMGFLKDVVAHVSDFGDILLDCLRICDVLANKLATSKIRDTKYKKELADMFSRLLNLVINLKVVLNCDVTDTEKQTSGVLDANFEVLCEVIPNIDGILQDGDKTQLMANSIVTNFIIPRTKLKKVAETPKQVLVLIDVIGKSTNSRGWKSLVSDLFMDKGFFNTSLSDSALWSSILSNWVANDRDKFGDIIAKITATSTTSPTNLFVWNEMSEIENKAHLIKRLTYLLLSLPKDYFLNYLENLFSKVSILLSGSCPDLIRVEITSLFRVITLKFNELHLLSKWTLITQELFAIFENLSNKTAKDLTGLSKEYLKLVLFGCKLLDQLLILSYDEFNLKEWLFVTTTQERDTAEAPTGIIDNISKNFDLTYLKDEPVKIDQPLGTLHPLLEGVKTIDLVTQLRLFFDSLGLIHYERTYGLYAVDYDACTRDVLDDLLV